MKVDINGVDPSFTEGIRRFLAENLPESLTNLPHAVEPLDMSAQKQWHEIVAKQGWVVPGWPREYGGQDWSEEQMLIFNEELNAAGAPALHCMTQLIGPVIYTFGTEAQKQQHLPGLLTGSTRWCQGFSEPEAGSNLAALRTRAVLDGDEYLVNGSKIWTTFAHLADWMFCLVRTSQEGRPQHGISFLLVDMKSPGVEIRPIISIDGLHHLNQVFLDDVRVPAGNLVGQENHGWAYAKFLLKTERFSAAPTGNLKAKLRSLHSRLDSENSWLSPERSQGIRRVLARVEIDVLALEAFSFKRLCSADAASASEGSSVCKLVGATLHQCLSEIAVDMLGRYALNDQSVKLLPSRLQEDDKDNDEGEGPNWGPAAMLDFLFGRGITIYGGASEVQKDILYKAISRQ